MSQPVPLRLVALLGLLLTTAPCPPCEARGEVDDEAFGAVVESLVAYREARHAGADVAAARTDLMARMVAFGDALETHPLSDPEQLEELWWASEGYDDVRVRGGKIVEETLHTGSFAHTGLEIATRTPRDYEPDRRYPLVVAIPDLEQGPAQHLRESWTDRDLLDRVVLVSPAMPDEESDWTSVMVDGRPGGLCHVLTALRAATQRFAIDFDRIYVCGHGKGVPAALATGNHAPHRFAGVFGRAGDAGPQSALGADNFRHLNTLLAGGAAEAQAFAAAVEAAGFETCELRPSVSGEELGHWMSEHVREPYPRTQSLRVGTPFPTRVGWLRLAPMQPAAHATATIDRAAHRITVDGEGVAFVTLYLNDALVDLGEPLTVVCNGVENEVRARRDLATWLDLSSDGTSDAGQAYVVELAFDMTGEATPVALASASEPDRELQDRLAAADDAAALWSLYEWCLATGREERAATVLPKVLRRAPDHAEARAAAGHVLRNGTWFETADALARFDRSQDPDQAARRGYVEHDSVWMHPDDRSQAGKGWTRNHETGLWSSADDRRRLADGWTRQDFQWVAPDEAGYVDEGLWLVDGEWLELAAANRRHARIDNPWHLPDAEVVVHATVERHVALRAREPMTRALVDLRKVFGAEPRLPLDVFVLRDEEQYDRFAFGAPDGSRAPNHLGRLHVLHSAVFAESHFVRVDGELEYRGMGACYWDAYVPYGDLYGVHSARLAVGLSYVDALDPSPKAVRKALRKRPGPDFYEDWKGEKELPDWLRYGGAVYAERFFEDETVDAGGDRWWARRWSLENLSSKGGLRALDDVFACALDPDDRDDGLKLLIEVGLVVAFIVDGGVDDVRAAQDELRAFATLD